MATYSITAPDGTIFDIEGPEGAPDEVLQQVAAREYRKMQIEAKRDKGGLVNAMKSSFEGVKGAIKDTASQALARAGYYDTASSMLDSSKQDMKEAGEMFVPTSNEYVAGKWKEGLFPGMKAQVRKSVTEPVGSIIGRAGPTIGVSMIPGVGLPAATVMEGAINQGENLQRQAQVNPGQLPDEEKALAATLLQTSVNMFGFGKIAHGIIGMNAAKNEASKLAKDVIANKITREEAVGLLGSNLRNILKESAAQAGVGASTSVISEAARRAQAGQNVTDREALGEYASIAKDAAIFGGVPGVFHGSGARGRAVRQLDRAEDIRYDRFDRPAEEARAAEEAKKQADIQAEADRAAAEATAAQARNAELAKQQKASRLREAEEAIKFVKDEQAAYEAAKARMAKEAEYSNVFKHPDLTGEFRPQRDETPVPTSGRRATDRIVDDFELTGVEQAELPFADRRAPAPETTFPQKTAEVQPRLTTAEDFDGMVRPQAAIIKKGEIIGKDMNNPADIDAVAKALNQHKRILHNIDDEKNAPRIQKIEEHLAALRQRAEQMRQPAPAELPLQGGHIPTGANDVRAFNTEAPGMAVRQRYDTDGNRIIPEEPPAPPAAPIVEPVVRPRATRKIKGAPNAEVPPIANEVVQPDGQAGVGSVGRGSERQAVAEGLPGAGRPASDLPAGAAGADVQRARIPASALALEKPVNVDLDATPTKLPDDFKALKKTKDRLEAALIQMQEDNPNRADAAYLKLLNQRRKDLERAYDKLHQMSMMGENPQDYFKGHDSEGAVHPTVMDAINQGAEPVMPMDVFTGGAQKMAEWKKANSGSKNNGLSTLKAIADTTQNPLYKELANKLIDSGIDARIKAKRMFGDEQGAYNTDAQGHNIDLDSRAPITEHTVLHEYTHAATVWAFDNPSKLNPKQRAAVQDLKLMYTQLKKDHPELLQHYGMENAKEMVAEAFTDPAFQKALSEINVTPKQTLWDKFVDKVAQILGIKPDSALHEVIRASTDLFEGAAGAKTEKPGSINYMKAGRVPYKSPIPERKRGLIEGAKHAAITTAHDARVLHSEGGKKALFDNWLWKHIDQGLGDINAGITRFLNQGYTEKMDGKTKASVRALLQHAPYAYQLGRVSLDHGYVAKNAEGMFDTFEDRNNMHSMLESIRKFPKELGENPVEVASAILTNLTYADREATAASARIAAKNAEAKARADMAAAAKLTGNKAAKKINEAKGRLAKALEEQQKADFKRPDNVTDETIAQAKRDANIPAVKEFLEIKRQINMQNIRTMEEGGLISKETADEWRKNEHYVPLQRVFEEDENFRTRMGGKLGGSSTGRLHGFEGSERDVDPITNMIRQRLWTVDAAMRNNAYLQAAKQLEEVGVTRRLPKKLPGMQNTITLKENGLPVSYQVLDAGAFRAFEGIFEGSNGALMGAMEKVTHLFRNTIMLDPAMTAKNLFRDSTEQWIMSYSSKGFARTLAANTAEFGRVMRNLPRDVRKGDAFMPKAEVVKHGITGQREFTSMDRELDQILRDVTNMGGSRGDWAGFSDKVLGRMLDGLQSLAFAGEVAPREQIYKQTLERTKSQTEATMAAINTMDFRRRGSLSAITYGKKLIPFFNSQLQGMYKIYQTLYRNDSAGMSVEQARAALIKKGIWMAAVSSIWDAVMSDDPEYADLPQDVKANNWMVPMGEGTFAKLPIPFDLGKMFKTIPEIGMQYMRDDVSSREATDALKAVLLSVTPGVIPQVVKPMIEIAANYNFYTGRNIETEAMKRLDKSERYNDATPEVAKSVAVGPISPVQANHILNGYFGSLGAMVMSVIDSTLYDTGKSDKPLTKQPGFRSLITDTSRSNSIERFYDIKGIADRAKATHKKLMESGETDKADEYLLKSSATGAPNEQMIALSDAAQDIDKAIKEARKEIKAIEADDTLTPSEKLAMREDVQKQINQYVAEQMPMFRKEAGE